MRWLLLLISVLFVLAAAAVADPGVVPDTTPSTVAEAKAAKEAKQPKSPPAEGEPKAAAGMPPAEIRKKSDTYFKQCMNDWDAATHMTKKEWQRTCRRITDERSKFLIEEMAK